MVERAILDETEMEFLYQDGDMYHFMNNETFEQIGLSAEVLGDAVHYLIPNIKLKIEMYEDRPVGIELPADGGHEGDGDRARDQGRLGLERGQARQDGDGPHRPGARPSSPRATRIRIDTASGVVRRARQVGARGARRRPGRASARLDRGHHRKHVQRQERGADPPGAPGPDRAARRCRSSSPGSTPATRRTRSSATPT